MERMSFAELKAFYAERKKRRPKTLEEMRQRGRLEVVQ
jgi:hypothetical protein